MTVTIHQAEALAWLNTQPDCSFDAALSDPPAGIGFMANRNSWDGNKGGRHQWTAWLTEIMRELHRVLKPGAHALIWAIPQTMAWTGWALEEAGFEVRNVVFHLVGNRMPKNHNVAVNIDKKLGGKRKKVGSKRLGGNAGVSLKDKGGTFGVQVGTAPAIDVDITESDTEEARAFDGHGTAIRSLVEPWFLVRKPLGDLTIVDCALRWGTGVINVDGCRIGDVGGTAKGSFPKGPSRGCYGDGLNGACDIVQIDAGRWPSNCILSDSAARDLDAAVGERPSTLTGRADPSGRHNNPGDNGGASSFGGGNSAVYADDGGPSRFFKQVAWTDEERTEFGHVLDTSHIVFSSKVSTFEREFGCDDLSLRMPTETVGRDEDSPGIKNGRAGAGRTGARRNIHSTVKTIALTEYLATMLLVPPHKDGSPRRIVVPFAGVGSEMIGAMRAGFEDVVGVEGDFDERGFVEIARARIKRWSEVPREMTVDQVRQSAEEADPRQVSLFDLAGGTR